MNHADTKQGLWYGFAGDFTGLIHERFAFCQNRDLKMEFDPDLVGYISAVETLEQLFAWFSRADIVELQKHGFYVHEYRATDFRWYERFGHYAIHQASSEVVQKLLIEPQVLAQRPLLNESEVRVYTTATGWVFLLPARDLACRMFGRHSERGHTGGYVTLMESWDYLLTERDPRPWSDVPEVVQAKAAELVAEYEHKAQERRAST